MHKHRDGNGSCGSLFYWCIMMHEREREGSKSNRQVSRSVGGGVEIREGENGKCQMSECGSGCIWTLFLVYLPLFVFLFPPPNLVLQV